jgi:N-hydroxyarylamine O-acetyltransferase
MTMTAAFDLDAYFQRIRYAGDRSPALATLQAIHLRHTEAIPFENLNPFLGWPVPLDAQSLQEKIVRDGRGGYCFEQNLLLNHALDALGFRVTGLAGRVLWNAPDGTVARRSHMLLRVDLAEGSYIADVGFGGQTLTGPLRLEPGAEQATPHEPFRLTTVGVEYILQAKIAGEWKTLYRFDLREEVLPDYEVINWYLSNHPTSRFVTGLIAARPAPGRRYALFNNEFAVHHLNGQTDRRLLATAAELRETLEDAFQLRLPNAPELDAALERVTARLGQARLRK